jgi:DNA polymerase eta
LHEQDWDDVTLSLGSEIASHLKGEIIKHLGYTCSAGIARNRSLAKLAAGHKKTNQQTVVRNCGIRTSVLAMYKFTKIRGLGKGLGLKVIHAFQTDEVSHLLLVSLARMQSVLGPEDGLWTYNIIRGVDFSEVTSRIHIQSMLSAKTSVPKITVDRAKKWPRIFVADLICRIEELSTEDHHVRPMTITLNHRRGWLFRPNAPQAEHHSA